MKPLKYSSGISMLSMLFIIAIASFFVTIIKEQTITTNKDITISLLDANIATKISEIGAQLGLNEVRNNSDFALQYTSGSNILDEQSTDDIFGIPGGTITLQLFSTTGDLNNDTIEVISTGKYNNTIRTTTLTLHKIAKKRMLLIEPTINPDNQFYDRKTTFENLDWDLTTILESDIDDSSTILNPIVAMSWNVIYIPQNITIDKDYFTDLSSPIATETISDTAHLGLITTSALNHDIFITTLRTAPTSTTHPPSISIPFSSSTLHFKTSELSSYVSGVIHEFTLDEPAGAYPTIPEDDFSVISWLPRDAIRSYGTTAPQARILLNIVPSNAYPWSLYNIDGISAINTVIEFVSCTSTDCNYFEIYNVQHGSEGIEEEPIIPPIFEE